ncbi:MAG TPA: putative sugar nucleotidyl transferase [Saprospiraceae bacterium]|nr:putative sugar nucleotidyl transferase [Saprospiraceae bacterium]
MRSIILFDDDNWLGLLPLTYTRPICELRVGILTIREKWEWLLEGRFSFITQEYLSIKFPMEVSEDNIIINASILPTEALASMIDTLPSNEAIIAGDELIAARIPGKSFDKMMSNQEISELKGINIEDRKDLYSQILRPFDIFQYNAREIVKDFGLITRDRDSLPLSGDNSSLNADHIFIEEGAKVNFSILNASEGPIYIGKDAIILEGSVLKGPCVVGEGGVIKVGAKIYQGTTIGPHCKAGGEIKESVIMAYSNKSHDGYMGNSVVGEWCNIGADTNTSNLKNNYEEVKLWNYSTGRFEKTGLQFCGLIMGDHSKSGINTMFNTGTTVGVSCNMFGSGYHNNFVPSFTWTQPGKPTTYLVEKAVESIQRMMNRKGLMFKDEDVKIMNFIYRYSEKWRTWEKRAV